MQSVNELAPELISLSALNSFSAHNSSSRAQMFLSHISQSLVTTDPDNKRILSGLEKELGKYTFNIKMPDDGTILSIIERYPQGVGEGSLNLNPETIVIYERESDMRLDYISIPYYCSQSQYFGFEYKKNPAIDKLAIGANIAKDTIFADSPSVSEEGLYRYGKNLNTAFMSLPSVAEDGFIISESAQKKFKFKIFETRVVELGSRNFPLNLYGDEENYKIFPDLGETLDTIKNGPEGLLMMLREHGHDLSPATMSVKDTMSPDYIFDKGIYVGDGSGKIIDIKVIGNNSNVRNLPVEMTEQLEKYRKAYKTFNETIIDTEDRLKYERKRKYGDTKLNLSPKLHSLLVNSRAIINTKHSNHKQPLNLLYRQNPVDEYRVEFTIEYLKDGPSIGGKLSNMHGGKGVICKICKDEDMPIDGNGNRADIIVDPTSIISRVNIGTLYEHFIGGVSRDIAAAIRNSLNVVKGKANVELLYNLSTEHVDKTYSNLLTYYKIVNTKQWEKYSALNYEERLEVLVDIVNDDLYTYLPVNNDKSNVDIVQELTAAFKTTYGPVTYKDTAGNMVTTINNIRIAPLYFMLLDKTTDGWGSVSSARLQHFGILSPLTKSEKFASPYRNTATRCCSETETRIYVGYTGPRSIAEIMDRSNNPVTQRNIAWNIMNSENSVSMDCVVDRSYISLGNSKPPQLIKHVTSCSGFVPTYEPEEQQ